VGLTQSMMTLRKLSCRIRSTNDGAERISWLWILPPSKLARAVNRSSKPSIGVYGGHLQLAARQRACFIHADARRRGCRRRASDGRRDHHGGQDHSCSLKGDFLSGVPTGGIDSSHVLLQLSSSVKPLGCACLWERSRIWNSSNRITTTERVYSSRPCTSAGGLVASTAVKVSIIL
jgi:hypothetical protein